MITFPQTKDRSWYFIVYMVILHALALNGFVFLVVFVAIRLKLTNVSGAEDRLSSQYQKITDSSKVLGVSTQTPSPGNVSVSSIDEVIDKLTTQKNTSITQLCSLYALEPLAPTNVSKILSTSSSFITSPVMSNMIFAVSSHVPDFSAYQRAVSNCEHTYPTSPISATDIAARVNGSYGNNLFRWPDTKEWKIVTDAISKDKELILQAADEANLEPRLLVSSLVVEQLRLYFSQRELYERYFEPLKILANSNTISLGVMSIKEETARAVEDHLRNPRSPYYLGPELEHRLDYQANESVSSVRYARLTSNDHFYSYLYGALYLKQMMVQWDKAGYSIAHRPEIVTTLFNVGFPQSTPNPEPKVGGSTISFQGNSYTFGRLGYEFYYSGELMSEFPITQEN